MAEGYETVIFFLSAILQFVVAGTLIVFRADHRACRVLAFALMFRGLLILTAGLESLGVAVGYWDAVQPYLTLTFLPAVLFLALVYPRPQPWLPREPLPTLALLVAILGFNAAYFMDHSLLTEPGAPLEILTFVLLVPYPLIAVLLLRDFLRFPDAAHGKSALLVSAAFCLIEIHDSILRVSDRLVAIGPAATPSSGEFVLTAVSLLEAAAFVALLVWLAVVAVRAKTAEVRRPVRIYVIFALLAALSAVLTLALESGTGAAEVRSVVIFSSSAGASIFGPIWDLALPLLVGYALLRHRLFGIDLRIKWTLRQSTLAAVFVGVFFIVSEMTAAFLSERTGTYVGILTAGALVFVIAPLQNFAQRFADVAMPHVKPTKDLTRDERLKVYREATVAAWADGTMERSERALLDRLQESLGISFEEAGRIERELLRASVGASAPARDT